MYLRFLFLRAKMKLNELKSNIIDQIPRTYNPYVHALVHSTIAVIFVIVSILLIKNLSSISLISIPITLFLLFGFEWLIHKHVLHRKRFGVGELYKKHELMHHVIYTNEDMSMGSKRELYLILTPPYAAVLILIILFPLVLFLTLLFSFNVALLMLITALCFFLSYEWLHFCYHLPENHWLGRNWLITKLKKLHTNHHNPLNMKKWNFNVTFPVFDLILKTYKKK